MTVNIDMIQRTATILFQSATVVEIRILDTPRSGTVSGYFDHPRIAAGHPLRPHVVYRLRRADWARAADVSWSMLPAHLGYVA